MHRADIIESIRLYQAFVEGKGHPHRSFDPLEEYDIINKFMMFIESTPDCFERTCKPGHITGSAMVISPDFERVLLTLHGKLDKWLQLGGHSDGNPNTHEVSLREVEEESGVVPLKIYEPLRVFGPDLKLPRRPLPFDFDYHFIPARKLEPDHIHYDVRYLVVSDDSIPPVMSDESQDLRWMTIDEARRLTDERSMHRQFDKIEFYRLSGRL
jgi:8-oxo-dGTP pyrophosphatase MutT (NUDIX family)